MYRSQNGIFILDYNGPFAEHKNRLMLNSIISLREDIAQKRAKAVLVSLKNAQVSGHVKALEAFVPMLAKAGRQLPVMLGFMDYDGALYDTLRSQTSRTTLKLFKNFAAARLYLDPKAYKEGIEVLVFDEDRANASQLAGELARFGYRAVIAADTTEFQSLSEETRFSMCVTQSALNIHGKQAAATGRTLHLSKTVVANLPIFVDTAVETLVSFTGLEAQKRSHAIKAFELSAENEMLCAVMRFKGDIEGVFVLIFTIELACLAMEAMLGEAVDAKDYTALKDGVGEFCNIITGGSKTALSKKEIRVQFDLPRTYTSLSMAQRDIGNNSGIWIDMQLASKPFYMFITR